MNYSNDLENSLAQYDSNSKQTTTMSKMRLSSLNTRKLLSYTAAASSAFVFSATADAAVIYSGTKNITSDGFVDINGGGNDFSITVSSMPGASSYGYANLNPIGGAQFIRTNFRDVKKLASGSTISAGGNFFDSQGSFRYVVIDSSGGKFEEGDWAGGAAGETSGFAGFKLNDNGTDIFGWLRFSIENEGPGNPFIAEGFPVKVTLIDWAYEDTGASILAGQKVSAVPLPGSLGLLAMGVSGLAAFRRRKKADSKA